MAVRRIRQLGDPILRTRCEPVKDPRSPAARLLADDLRDTLKAAKLRHKMGRALAAPQIGAPVRMVMVETGKQRWTMVNPEITDVGPDAQCFAEETFGPVVSIYRVDNDNEAIAAANASRYGLNASVWSRSAARGRAVAAQLRAGTVNVNEAYAAAWGSMDAPMGGMGDSGLGRRHGDHFVIQVERAEARVNESELFRVRIKYRILSSAVVDRKRCG